VMTLQPSELLHMDIVGPARVCSFGGMWHVLVVVDDFYCYSLVFFMKAKDETFTHARDLILTLQNEFPKNVICWSLDFDHFMESKIRQHKLEYLGLLPLITFSSKGILREGKHVQSSYLCALALFVPSFFYECIFGLTRKTT
jgi:hypothetical protein